MVSLNVSSELMEIVRRPKHGYGSNMNPCIDCRILLFKKAKELMRQEGASFVITGEVLGQRPMSQKLNTMRLIEKEAGLVDLVLRPLSAKVMEPTLPERSGWVPRERLLAISGRSRRQQFGLAKEFGINDYPCPSGGCLLTDPDFSRRVKDLMEHDEFDLHSVQLLKVGRHFRIDRKAKLIVGRNEKENRRLLGLAQAGDYLFMPQDQMPGPTSVGRGKFNIELIRLSCSITSRYCDLAGETQAGIIYKRLPENEDIICKAQPLAENYLAKFRI